MTDDKNERKRSLERSKHSQVLRCPWCYSTRIDAHFVDIGVGMQQASPYHCVDCGGTQWSESDTVVDVTAEERRYGWWEGNFMVWKTAQQRHCNAMLYMRRMFKEIALLLRLQDPDYEIDDDEVERVLQLAGWDELRIERALKRLMKRLDETTGA